MNVIKYLVMFTVISVAILSTIIYYVIKPTNIDVVELVVTTDCDSSIVVIEDLNVLRGEIISDDGFFYIEFDTIVAAVEKSVAKDIIYKINNENNIKFNLVKNINDEYEIVRQ